MMKDDSKKKISAVVFGEGSFALACIQLMLDEGIELSAVLSNNRAISRMAIKYKYRVLDSMDEVLSLDEPIDYIFSFASQKYVNETILKKAKYFGVNFHPSPLPKYAGVRSTSWAILNDEKQYGCAWHVMNADLDGGDILKVAYFYIEKNDTAMSLTMRCYEHGILLFKSLLEELQANKYCLSPQDKSKRIYYSYRDSLGDKAYVDWSRSSAELLKVFRACQVGRELNQNFSLKLKVVDKDFFVNKMSCSGERSQLKPGEIVRYDPDTVRVATGTTDVLINELVDEEGVPVSFPEFIKINERSNFV